MKKEDGSNRETGEGAMRQEARRKNSVCWLTGFIEEKPFYILRTRIASTRWPQRRAFIHGFHRSSPFLFVFSRSVPRKSGGRNKATGNRPSGTLAWWWRHLVPLGAEFYGGERIRALFLQPGSSYMRALSPCPASITPFTFFLALHVSFAARILNTKVWNSRINK